MTQFQITKDKINEAMSNSNGKEIAINFAKTQPNLALRLLQKYGYIPNTAIVTFTTLAKHLPDEIPVISFETIDGVMSQLASNKEKVITEFQQQQPDFSQLLNAVYAYIPTTAPTVILSVYHQMSLSSDEFASFMEKIHQDKPEGE